MELLAHYFVTAIVFVIIDAIWIAGVANSFYKDQMGSLLAHKPKFLPAVIFYAIYIVALQYLIIEPALTNHHDWTWVIQHALILGIAMYATYDLTNASTLKNWPIKLTIVDMLWGTTITTVVCAASFAIFR